MKLVGSHGSSALLFMAKDEGNHGAWCPKLWSEGVGCQVYPRGDWKGNREGNIWYISPLEHLYPQSEDSKGVQIWSHEAYGG